MDAHWTAPTGAGNRDALLGLLLPLWQLTVGLFMVFALVIAGTRLVRRGRSRMAAALVYVAVAIFGLIILAFVVKPS